MKKITIKNLIDFRRKTERSKKTFAYNLKLDRKSDDSSGGGDYWISCLSSISNVFKYDEIDYLRDKIDILTEKIDVSEDRRIKMQFQRNIDILFGFEEFDFNTIRPKADLKFLKKPSDKSLIVIKGYPVQARPHHVFSFSEKGSDEIGAVWFVAKLGGYKKSELGMFADILYRYLEKHYSKDFYVNPKYCIAIDVVNGNEVNYEDIKKGKVPILIESTIEEIKKI
jgi:hypothetical protein